MIDAVSPSTREIDNMHLRAVERVIAMMRQELASPLSLSDLASAGLFSRYHFHRIFRAATTMTPARFLAALRMAQARRLLLHTSLTVAGIGSSVGYASTGTFATQFTRLVGASPLRFRELVRRLVDRPISYILAAAGVAAALPDPYGVMVVELRLDGGGGMPGSWCAASQSRAVSLDPTPAVGEYETRVLLIDGRATPTEALVDQVSGSYLTGVGRLRLSPDGKLTRKAEVSLRQPLPTDPPVLSVAPLRWLADLASGMRHRDDSGRRDPREELLVAASVSGDTAAADWNR